MANRDNVLRLIIAEESLNDAEQLVSVLRNDGLAVRPTRVVDDEELQAAHAAQSQDLLLCAPGLDAMPLEVALRVLAQSGKDVPLLVLSADDDPELRVRSMGLGAVDLVSKADIEHFRLAVRREFRGLQERRRLRLLESRVRETERRCHTLLDSSRDAIAYVHEGMHVYANASYLERFGIDDVQDLEGLPILDLVTPEDQPRFKEFLRRHDGGEDAGTEIELTVPGANGEQAPAVMTFSAASWDGEACTQVLLREQVPEIEMEAQLPALGRRDVLTGLHNRSAFLEALEQDIAASLAAESGAQNGLLYIQVDNPNAIQDNLGISALDTVLADLARIIGAQVGDGHLAGRYSDTVLAVLLRGCGVHDAVGIGGAIRSGTEGHISEHAGRTNTKSCSIGVALISDAVSQAGQAINLAHGACEVARREGGDRVHLYAATEEGEGDGVSWKNRLEDALHGEGFELLFQPLVALAGDQEERYEAHLHLRSDDGALLHPREFLPPAVRLGLGAQVDRWVLEQTLSRLAERGRSGTPATIFIKLSGATVSDREFAHALADGLERHAVPGEQLVLQINEPVALTQLNEAKALFKAAKELHCGFALDQFGSGLNPFQLVKHLPADFLKLDRALTEDLTISEERRETVGNVIRTAHEMRKQVVVGHLQEATVLATLWQYQVDLVQGDFLGETGPELNYDFSGMVI